MYGIIHIGAMHLLYASTLEGSKMRGASETAYSRAKEEP